MRKVVLGLGISLDGYIARPDGSVDFLFMPKDYGKDLGTFLKKLDVAILGRKTYDIAKALGGGDFGNTKPYVFSRSLPPGERDGIIFVNESPADLVARLRAQPGKDMWLMGGGELAREFLKADLVDEMYIGILPVLIGEGIPLFPSGFPQREFELVENKSYSRGLVALMYRRAGAKTGSEPAGTSAGAKKKSRSSAKSKSRKRS
jgi:dihydrofolate reductase